MEFLAAIGSLINCLCEQKCFHGSVSNQCRYMRKPLAVVERLDEKMEMLLAREIDVRRQLNLERLRNDMETKAEVDLWLRSIDKLKGGVAFIKEQITPETRCLSGCFPNYCSRFKMGNRVYKKIGEVDKLLERGKFSDCQLVDRLPGRGVRLPTAKLIGETTERICNQIWDYMKDEEIERIGIHGMGGVGKTTIMMEINNLLLNEDSTFDSVVWVSSSKETSLQQLQKNIARAVGLDISDDVDEMKRAADLLEALSRRKKFVLIIDDLWEAFPLECIGIPNPLSSGCKLVITTRLLKVCRGMETVREVEVNVLSEEEAWKLFEMKVGEEVLLSPEIQVVARDVAKECGGLPLAIVTVGRALRKEIEIVEWKNALSELRDSTARIEGMENQVFARLRFSYERLRDSAIKSCFLCCAMYPEDHLIEIDELIRLWMWEGLLGDTGRIETKLQRGKVIHNELKNACMLDSVNQNSRARGEKFVKMHDLVRDLAISITRVKPLCIIQAGQGLRDPPREDEWPRDLERVSLMRNDLAHVTPEPRCPKLCTLLLQYNSISKGMNPNFFSHMRSLKVLDLSYTGIDRLPESLSNLRNLRALLLCSCWNLSYIPTLENLKKLNVLDLSCTPIFNLPEGMDMLVNLRCLNLSGIQISCFPMQLLSIFKNLESLLMAGLQEYEIQSFLPLDKWNVREICRNLSELEAHIFDKSAYEECILFNDWINLNNFKLYIGYPSFFENMAKNSVGFFGEQCLEENRPIMLPSGTLELVINGCSNITCLPRIFNSQEVRQCTIQFCRQMECISGDEMMSLPNLKWLKIHGLMQLKGLCRKNVPAVTFANLTVLNISACNGLKKLLSVKFLQYLTNIEQIEIECCSNIEEIITVEADEEMVFNVNNGEETKIVEIDAVKANDQEPHNNIVEVNLPRLHSLKLISLPSLTSICKTAMLCESLYSVEILRCPILQELPLSVDFGLPLSPSLKHIKGSKTWWNALRWNNPESIKHLYPLFQEHAEVQQMAIRASASDNNGGEHEIAESSLRRMTTSTTSPRRGGTGMNVGTSASFVRKDEYDSRAASTSSSFGPR